MLRSSSTLFLTCPRLRLGGHRVVHSLKDYIKLLPRGVARHVRGSVGYLRTPLFKAFENRVGELVNIHAERVQSRGLEVRIDCGRNYLDHLYGSVP